MNKIFTLLAAAGLAMSANATVLWEGSEVMGNWKGMLSLDCESPTNWTAEVSNAMADMEVGDKLVFTYTDVSTDSEAPGQIQIDAKVGPSWTWTAMVEYDNIPADGVYSYEITDAPIADSDYTELETLPERGFFVKGQNATLVKVELVKAGGPVQTTETVVWEGNFPIQNWNAEFNFNVDAPANWTAAAQAAMKGLKAGDKIVFSYTDCADNAQIALACKVGEAWTWTEIIPYADIKNGQYTYKVTEDEMAGESDYTVLEVISERGFVVKGQGATLVKIAIVAKEGGDPNPPTPPTPTTGVTLWEGSVVMGAWKGMLEYKPLDTNDQWNASAMESMEEGSKLVFHYIDVVGTDEAPAQIQLATFALDAAWSWAELVPYDNVVNAQYTYTVEDAPVGDADFTDLEMLKEHGFAVKGQNATLVKVELVNPGAGVENVAVDNVIDFNAPVEIYTIDGRRVADMTQGRIYIVRQGNKVAKIAK